jgi:ribosomal-protein-alanine N-acetyltransferase
LQTRNLPLRPHLPTHLIVLSRSEQEYEKVSGFRAAQGIRDFLLVASPDFFQSLKSAVEPDPWRFGFAILHRADEVMIGLCGFAGPPDGNGVVEFGYSIAPEYQGKGYATEAAMALSEFATKDSRVRTICAHTLSQPNASTACSKSADLPKSGNSSIREATVSGAGNGYWQRADFTGVIGPIRPM